MSKASTSTKECEQGDFVRWFESQLAQECNKVKEDAKYFRLEGRVFLLTYKTHLNKGKLLDFLGKVKDTKKESARHIVACHETGNEGSYPHTHVVLYFLNKVSIRKCDIFDIDGDEYAQVIPDSKEEIEEGREYQEIGRIHPHMKKLKEHKKSPAEKLLRDALKYISKEDNEALMEANSIIEGLNGNYYGAETDMFIERISKYEHTDDWLRGEGVKDMKEGLEVLRFKNEFDKANNMKNYRTRENIIDEDDLYLWQRRLIDIVSMRVTDMSDKEYNAHKRIVNWIYDPVGDSGKSTLSTHMDQLNKGDWIQIPNITAVKDVMYTLKEALANKTWNGHGIFVDMPRMMGEYKINTAIEQIKNGSFNSTKYTAGTVEIDSPYVVIFANMLPNEEVLKGFSLDRWNIMQINDRMDLVRLKWTKHGYPIPIECNRELIQKAKNHYEKFFEDNYEVKDDYDERISKRFNIKPVEKIKIKKEIDFDEDSWRHEEVLFTKKKELEKGTKKLDISFIKQGPKGRKKNYEDY
uniref:Replication-associated protein n=1 Tax=Red panda feces-associated circular DNA virus 15 TaxID=2863968 RepID=A0A8K1M587_9VIRU|nr:replication-associated protein [Red panda feces-associated circular DNA virus 15]